MTETYPRQKAATRNFLLGAPRSFHITANGDYVLFLRSDHGRDAANSLWLYDLTANVERKIIDPRELLADSDDIPAAERARRERMRETTSGITSFTTDSSGLKVAFALSGQLFSGDIISGNFISIPVQGAVIDPHMSPDGHHIAWSDGRNVHIGSSDGSSSRMITNEDSDSVTWGLADFIAAEELRRMNGLWWSPNSDSLIVERVDNSQVKQWWISDPANPDRPAVEHRYPAAGTTNADISLFAIDLHGSATQIDLESFEYIVSVAWAKDKPALITLADRLQKQFTTYALTDHGLELAHTASDEQFIDVTPGLPRWVGDELLTLKASRETDTYELQLGTKTISPAGLQVFSVLGVNDDFIDATCTRNGVDVDVCQINFDGTVTHITHQGVASATATSQTPRGKLQVISESTLESKGRTFTLLADGKPLHVFDNLAETPLVTANATLTVTGPHAVNTAVLFPTDHVLGSKKLPVLMRPYGGPHAAQVLRTNGIFRDDQWFADQGFAVIVADNRGTPGRGPLWDHTIHHDFVNPVLDDQVSALNAIATQYPKDIDTTRVGITGWSFGGYLAALAVLERPDVFHAAVAGAPVTEWLWYDTGYTERYLGNPNDDPQVYERNSLIHRAGKLTRPLMLVHGLADDNVVAAHTLALSNALLAHGKAHTVLPLSGVTHMTPQEVIAENLMLLTVQFLKENLKA